MQHLIVTTRNSVVEQLKSANALYDVVRALGDAANNLPPEQLPLKQMLEKEALKIFQEANTISSKAAAIGKNLAEMVGGS